jgi:uridine kinase
MINFAGIQSSVALQNLKNNQHSKPGPKKFMPELSFGKKADVLDLSTPLHASNSNDKVKDLPQRLKKASQLMSDLARIIEEDQKRETPVLKKFDRQALGKMFDIALKQKEQPVVVGVAGGSASGKTTITKGFLKNLNNHTGNKEYSQLISQDNYYKDFSQEIKEKGADRVFKEKNLDCPDAVHLDLLARDLAKLKQNKEVKIPEFLINGTGVSKPEAISVKPSPFVFVEGLFTLGNEKLRDLFDLKVFIDASKEVRANRWWDRAASRNIKHDEAGEALFKRTFSMHDKHVEPGKAHADIILNSEANFAHTNTVIDQIALAISRPITFAGKLFKAQKAA